MLEFWQPFYIHLQSVRITIYGRGAFDSLLIEEGSGLLIPKGIVKVKTDVNLSIACGSAEVGGGGKLSELMSRNEYTSSKRKEKKG